MRTYLPLMGLWAVLAACGGGSPPPPTSTGVPPTGDTGLGDPCPDDTSTAVLQDLVVSDGDELSGRYEGIGRFEVPEGVTVRVTGNEPLVVEARSIYVYGSLIADGQGHPGGSSYSDGGGPGGGRSGGYMMSGTGGGFAGSGGAGFNEYGAFYGSAWRSGGPPVHRVCSAMGSGGGWGEDGVGGPGGGAVRLIADEIVIDGVVSARGGDGLCDSGFGSGDLGGGGGSGGLVELRACALTGTGRVDVSGGRSCEEADRSGGGGGGGGWVVLQGEPPAGLTLDVSPGEGPVPGEQGFWPAQPGRLSIDADDDGLGEDEELALGLDPENPDTDGDGVEDGPQATECATSP